MKNETNLSTIKLDQMLEEDFVVNSLRDHLSAAKRDYLSISRKLLVYRDSLEVDFLKSYCFVKELVKCFNFTGLTRLKKVVNVLSKSEDSLRDDERVLYDKYSAILADLTSEEA